MELLQLKYFCDAAETENFSKTANKYFVPTSNISQTIKRLEKELDTELFIRTANKIKLNENGKIFYDGVKKIFRILEETKEKLSEQNEELRGEIKILALTNRRIVTETIEKFKMMYPEISYILSHSYNENESEFDIIISDGSFKHKSYTETLLFKEKIFLALKKEHPLVSCKINISDLKNERFISMTAGSSLNRITNQICENAGFSPKIVIHSDDPYYIRKYIEMGLGIGFIPEVSWKGQISENIVLKDITDIQREIYVLVHKDKYVKKSVKLFSNLLYETAKNC